MAKPGYLGPMPWDMVIYLSITAVGFGFSVKKIVSPDVSSVAETDSSMNEALFAESSPHIVNFGCIEKSLKQSLSTSEGAIRIKGSFCHLSKAAMKDFAGAHVKNLSTGEERTLFFKDNASTFISDFVKLKQGKNLIQVEWRDSKDLPARRYLAEVYEK